MAASRSGRQRDVLEVVRACQNAYADGRWDALRGLYHPDCLLETVAAQGRLLGREATIAALAAAPGHDPLHEVTRGTVTRLDEQAAVLSGRARRATAVGFSDSPQGWLWTVLDDRLYRSVLVAGVEEGRRLYLEHGLSLGRPAPAGA